MEVRSSARRPPTSAERGQCVGSGEVKECDDVWTEARECVAVGR